jgi:hypothetical protein
MSQQIISSFTEVGLLDARTSNGFVIIPNSTEIPFRILTLKDVFGSLGSSTITLSLQGSDIFEDGSRQMTLTNKDEAITLYAGQPGYWYVLNGTRMNAVSYNSISVGTILSPLQVGTISSMSQIVFPGLRSNYNTTAILETSTGIGTQELLLFKGSSVSDRVRVQTTGNIVFESGVPSRTYLNATSLAIPSMLISRNSNVGIGLSEANINSLLDVGGQGRFLTLSTFNINTSTINGQIFNIQTPLQSTFVGLGTGGYVSTIAIQELSNFYRNNIQDFSTAILSTTQGLGTTGYVSTTFLFEQFSSFSTSLGYLGGSSTGDITKDNVISSIEGLGTIGYTSTTYVLSQISSFSTALGFLGGTGTGDLTTANITSTVQGLGTTGYASTSFVIQQISSFSTSLGQLGGGTGDLTTANITSTVQGLGNIYLSSGGGGTGDITTANITSTVQGLGTSGYVSTTYLFQEFSSFSTSLGYIGGGGGTGDITTGNLTSTVVGLTESVSSFYIDIPELVSTVNGLLQPRPVTFYDF